MKKHFLFTIVLSAFIFTNCKKEDYNPLQNHLVVTDRKSYTTSCKPTSSSIQGKSSANFDIFTTGSTSNGFDVYMSFDQGVPNPVIFSPAGSSQGVILYIHYYTGVTWRATKGIVQMEVENGTHPSDKCPKSAEITLNDMQFIKDPFDSYASGIPDTLWVSGIINARRML